MVKLNLSKLKIVIVLLIWNLAFTLSGQTKEEMQIKTDVSEVTVYMTGAQIKRSKSIDVPAGRNTIKFIGLSPYIDSKSVNVNVKGSLTVLSVNHQQNFLTEQNKSKETEQLLENKEELERKINLENTFIEVLKEESAFLKANNSIGGSNTGTSISALKEADKYFSERITAIKLKEIESQNKVEKLTEELEKVGNQLNVLSNKKELPSGEILVTVDAVSNTKANFEIKYLVKNAGWFPSYDIRVKNIELPANLAYKANIHQNTNEDWKNVKLKLSSTDPNASGTFRDLKTYFLGYNYAPPTYYTNVSQVSGHIYLKGNKSPLPGATVVIKGTSIGTISDVNGYYSLSVPKNGGALAISFVGCKTQELPITNAQIDAVLEEDRNSLNETVVVGYGAARPYSFDKISEGGAIARSKKQKDIELPQSVPVETEQILNQTSVEFDIKNSYSIPSDGKNLTVEIENYSLPADYRYFCTPKIDKGAYLLAQIIDWEKYNLIEGEASVFFEDTYTGKTLLDVRYMSDTLSVSLGLDKGVTVNREIQKQFTTKQFLSTKKEEAKSWLITVRNNKQQNIKLSVIDQIPVSTNDEIEVSPLNISNGNLDPENGKIKWEFQLQPAEKKEIDLKYSVRYPKDKRLVVE